MTPPEVEEGSPETPRRGAVSQHHRYYTLLRRSRLLATAFWVALLYFCTWAIPWLPGGLSEEDYNRQLALTITLASTCAALGIGTIVLRENLRRTREALLAWRSVYDDTTGLFNRRYFYDRLSLECERARREGTTFTLVIMRLESSAAQGGLSGRVLRRLASALTRATRANDLVALLGRNQLAVVAMGVSGKMVPQMLDRLRKALERPLADSRDGLSLRLGAATYSARSRHPSVLLREARRSLSVKPSSEEAGAEERAA